MSASEASYRGSTPLSRLHAFNNLGEIDPTDRLAIENLLRKTEDELLEVCAGMADPARIISRRLGVARPAYLGAPSLKRWFAEYDDPFRYNSVLTEEDNRGEFGSA
jgi:hypothetical protein